MVEMVLYGGIDQLGRLGRGELLLRLSLERRIADEHRQQDRGAAEHVVGRDLGRALVADKLAERLDAARQGRAQAHLMAAALRGGHGVAVGVDEAFLILRPRDGPFRPPGVAVEKAPRPRKGRG